VQGSHSEKHQNNRKEFGSYCHPRVASHFPLLLESERSHRRIMIREGSGAKENALVHGTAIMRLN
jgi:hypothetical protein